jgi:uncharacterized membrane protein
MKIKLLHNLLIVDILVVLLILAILLVPDSWLRIVLGLPFLLFFPGYALIEALFVRRKHDIDSVVPELDKKKNLLEQLSQSRQSSKSSPPETGKSSPATANKKAQTDGSPSDTRDSDSENGEGEEQRGKGLDGIERMALSFGMSIAVTALIGLGLNYTPWGIRLLPVLFAISAFIVILSGVALFRQRRLNGEWALIKQYTFKMPGWEGSHLNKALTVILVVAILAAVGTLIYTVAFPRVGERFTEFYILGLEGKAADYPAAFTLDATQTVVSVQYGDAAADKTIKESSGRLTLGIINQEQQPTSYAVELQIDGQPVPILWQGQSLARLEGIQLEQGETWEQPVAFAPQHTGDNQKVEFLLYKDGSSEVYNTLHLWVDAGE